MVRPMKAVTSALANGAITRGEAERIAAVVDTFIRAIETSGSTGGCGS
jgi:hypothetical protein